MAMAIGTVVLLLLIFLTVSVIAYSVLREQKDARASGDIESFTEEERTKIYKLMDMAISYHKTKKAYSKA